MKQNLILYLEDFKNVFQGNIAEVSYLPTEV